MNVQDKVKLMLDLEYLKKLQKELPSKYIAIFTSLFQFLIGAYILSYIIKNSEIFSLQLYVFLFTVLSIGIILFSAYTYFGYILRKRYILLIESLIQKDNSVTD